MELLGFFPLLLIISVFLIGYVAIILEDHIKVNKTAVALFIAVLCWTIYFVSSGKPLKEDAHDLEKFIADISQVVFFLIGAMSIVELVDLHQGFKIVTDYVRTKSMRKMLWLVSLISFFLSAILDNLTTTILMISMLKKLVPNKSQRFLLSCMVVVAANAGGAWTPIGDVTTTMLWINGQLSSMAVISALFIPSFVSLLVPLAYFSWKMEGGFDGDEAAVETPVEPRAGLVLVLGIGSLIFVPIFKALTGLPPFMGVIIGLATLWIVTDLLHDKHEKREHLRIPHVLSKIDTSGVLFFLGILLAVDALQSAGVLNFLAAWLDRTVHNQAMIATLIGIFSAIVDNVPLVAATMGMYSLSDFPMDDKLWHMIAYGAGTGGSLLIIGSAAGVALMGLEKIDFVSYMKKMTLPVLVGYLLGMVAYLALFTFSRG